jgi:hypothetical protein
VPKRKETTNALEAELLFVLSLFNGELATTKKTTTTTTKVGSFATRFLYE